MRLLYLTQIAATNFTDASILRHFKNAPPLVFFGFRQGPLTLPPPPSLALALLFWLLLLRLLFCAGPALLHGPTLGIAFRFLTPRAKENSACKQKFCTLQAQQAHY